MNSNIVHNSVELQINEKMDHDKTDLLLNKLQDNIKPILKLTTDDVYIRVMYIVSDEVNSYGGKFAIEQLKELQSLIVDSPVMVGHRKDKLPIARNFHAEIEEREGIIWLKSYFYWLKDADGAESLRENIDGGIYKECSIGFTFNFPECSLCGKDIRRCRHEPFIAYKEKQVKTNCFYFYKDIEKVLETSLVYRGAVKGTTISKDFNENLHSYRICNDKDKLQKLVKDTQYYMISPHYEGLDIRISNNNEFLSIDVTSNEEVDTSKIDEIVKKTNFNFLDHFAIVVGYQGKERHSRKELIKFLNYQKSKVTRVEVKLFPTDKLLRYKEIVNKNIGLSYLRCKTLCGPELLLKQQEFKTRDGIRIWEITHECLKEPDKQKEENRFSITKSNYNEYILQIADSGKQKTFRINNFSEKLLHMNRKFLIQQSEYKQGNDTYGKINEGKYTVNRENFCIHLTSTDKSNYKLHPIQLNCKELLIFYKV